MTWSINKCCPTYDSYDVYVYDLFVFTCPRWCPCPLLTVFSCKLFSSLSSVLRPSVCPASEGGEPADWHGNTDSLLYSLRHSEYVWERNQLILKLSPCQSTVFIGYTSCMYRLEQDHCVKAHSAHPNSTLDFYSVFMKWAFIYCMSEESMIIAANCEGHSLWHGVNQIKETVLTSPLKIPNH